jgi:hypothetical protein
MATKKILVSDNSGSTQELITTHIGYDDVRNQVSASKITAHNLSSSLPSGILQSNGNFISGSVITGSGGASGSLLQISGSRYVFNLPTNIGGDLSGSTTALNNVKVISVANVNSGTLAFANGGTGLSSALSGVLIKGAGDTLQVLATADTGSVIGLLSGSSGPYWAIDPTDPTTNYPPRVDVYTANNTWTKKGNPRFLKVTVIGGGGGGGAGYGGVSTSQYGGRGGGGGGYTQVLLEAANVSGAVITIGAGGTTGSIPTPGLGQGTAGGNGLSSVFSCSAGSFYATGGGGGSGSGPGPVAVAYSGLGNIFSPQTQIGGLSTAGNQNVQTNGGNGVYTTGGGAGSGGGTTTPVARESTASGILLFGGSGISASSGISNTPASIIGSAGVGYAGPFDKYYLNGTSTLYNTSINPVFGTGGGGGGGATTSGLTPANAGSGGNGLSGSGGGGGGNRNTAAQTGQAGRGGSGGNGVVIIESY